MISLDDIQSLTDFKRNTAKYLKKMKKTKGPVVLTVNGRAEVVVQDARAYQEMLVRVERAETIAALKQGIEEFKKGGRPAGAGGTRGASPEAWHMALRSRRPLFRMPKMRTCGGDVGSHIYRAEPYIMMGSDSQRCRWAD
jgi:prevent-host-death family protein